MLLSIRDLHIRFRLNEGYLHAVNGVSFDIKAGEKLALVGESGSGKSQIAFAILGLLAKNGEAKGKILYGGQDLLALDGRALNKIRSREIAIIFQDPMSALNPYMKIGRQLEEVLECHEGKSRGAARARVIEMLDAVKMPDAKRRLGEYPHELSGGQRQRVIIAMALLCRPRLILADEPTTALDVTVQAQILRLLNEISHEFGTSILLITHDLGVVAGFSEEVLVIYGGRLMERASAVDLFAHPTHPYTRGLLGAIPKLGKERMALRAIPGSPPNMMEFPTACPFAPRCVDRIDECSRHLPEMAELAPRRACLLPEGEIT